jgi:murein DD-endopeptidase MepM/ murein hydrolase activator NlpD
MAESDAGVGNVPACHRRDIFRPHRVRHSGMEGSGMTLRRVSMACVAFLATAAGASACEMAGFNGLEALRLHRPVAGAVVSGFGMRKHPLLQVSRFHNGLDLAARTGDPVKAAAKGRVVLAGPSDALGNLIRIDHGNGLSTAYAHLHGIDVRVGDCVGEGQVIGFAGSTGLAAEPMLHFEVESAGKHVDPAPAIGEPVP